MFTDEIERFTETGVLLRSGQTLDADITVTATEFHISLLGDIDFKVNGKPLDYAQAITYRGIMLTGVPNFAWVYGYNVYSWTLRSDLSSEFVCRMLRHMRAQGHQRVTPTLRPQDADMQVGPWVTGPQRIADLPNVPTFTELGFQNFEPRGWHSMFAPVGTPAPVVAKLSAEINRILRLPDVTAKIDSLGITVGAGTPEEFAHAMRTDAGIYSRIVKAANIRINQ